MAAIEILKSTMRTREYVEKGEAEGKTLLDAMRDGETEGMQHFDGEIEKFIRARSHRRGNGMKYATIAGISRGWKYQILRPRKKPEPEAVPVETLLGRVSHLRSAAFS